MAGDGAGASKLTDLWGEVICPVYFKELDNFKDIWMGRWKDGTCMDVLPRLLVQPGY